MELQTIRKASLEVLSDSSDRSLYKTAMELLTWKPQFTIREVRVEVLTRDVPSSPWSVWRDGVEVPIRIEGRVLGSSVLPATSLTPYFGE